MKKFIITVDTEGDNLWKWKPGQEITTQNALFLPRFQTLCENYGFYPVYLTNFEMTKSRIYKSTIGQSARNGKCEIGMHLHAWNTPPIGKLERKYNGLSYITEFPQEIVFEKHEFLKKEIENTLDISPLTYRSGRWATNDILFQVLGELVFIADCSITPEISWKNCPGTSVAEGNDYRFASKKAYRITEKIIEVPLTSRKIKCFYGKNIKSACKNLLVGIDANLRPATASLDLMKKITKQVEKEKNDYLEFMLHSSELMPGGSPYFCDEESIERVYRDMEEYFKWIAERGYEGITLRDYAKSFLG